MNPKAILQSKTLWTLLAAFVAWLLARFGYNLSPEDQTTLTADLSTAAEALVPLLMLLASVFHSKTSPTISPVNAAEILADPAKQGGTPVIPASAINPPPKKS